MKKVIAIVFISILIKTGYPQELKNSRINTADSNAVVIPSKPPYVVERFLIDPIKKTVSGYTMVGGTNKDGSIWDGYTYVVNKAIKYNKTRLVILGCHIFFKEYFPFKGDLDHLKIISCDEGFVRFRDKNTIYFYNVGLNKITSKDVSEYKTINDWVYQDKAGWLYFLYGDSLERLTKSTHFDTKTLNCLVNNFYTDKNGLYYIEKHYRDDIGSQVLEAVKLEDNDGTNVLPTLAHNYFIYKGNVYAINYKPNKLKLEADKIVEIEWNKYNQIYSITDGNMYYDKRNYEGYLEPESNGRSLFGNAMVFFVKNNIKVEAAISPISTYYQKDTSTFYFRLGLPKVKDDPKKYKEGVIIKTSDGYYFLTTQSRTNLQKVKRLLIYNVDEKKDEDFEINEFKYFVNGFSTYRNHFFAYNYLVEKGIDIKNLRFVNRGDFRSNYLTDGKLLIYTGGSNSSYTITNGEKQMIFEDVIKGINTSRVRIINQDKLIDDDYLYYGSTVIPLKALGINIVRNLQ